MAFFMLHIGAEQAVELDQVTRRDVSFRFSNKKNKKQGRLRDVVRCRSWHCQLKQKRAAEDLLWFDCYLIKTMNCGKFKIAKVAAKYTLRQRKTQHRPSSKTNMKPRLKPSDDFQRTRLEEIVKLFLFCLLFFSPPLAIMDMSSVSEPVNLVIW
jgi:hypothetical protein